MIELVAVRHGQSTANVAFPAADAVNSEDSGLTGPDALVELTPLGREQSAVLGRRLAEQGFVPDVVLSSPYRRARDTARIALDAAGADVSVRVDERLRDRELGILEMMTRAAIRRHHPTEITRWDRSGEFLYRPPGGESMADVALRIRSLVGEARSRFDGKRVLMVGHDATVLMLRYVLEDLTPEESEAIGPIGNASVTRWRGSEGRLALAEFNTPAAP